MNKLLRRGVMYKDIQAFFLSSLTLMWVFGSQAFAEGSGIDNSMKEVKAGICSILTGLNVVSIATVTIAIMWCGYKWLYKHAEISEIARIFVGSLFIAGAAQIAKMLMNAGGTGGSTGGSGTAASGC